MSKPKILHVITGLGEGGAEGVLFRLCSADRQWEHVVVSLLDEGKYGPALSAANVTVHALHMPRGRITVGALAKLWRIMRAVKPDLVQTWLYHGDLVGGVMARIAGCRNIVWNIRNSLLEPQKASRSTIAVARLCAKLSRFVPKRIVCCAENAAVVHAGIGYAHENMRVIPNGYDLSRYSPGPDARVVVCRELGLDFGQPVLGYVARFDPQKDHRNLLRAVALVRAAGHRFSCLLVGRGLDSSNAMLLGWITELGLEDVVRLAGSRSDIPAVMNALDLHVMSSAYGEGFPNVLAEAMACGTPCISTDVGDARPIVGDTGWIVPPQEPEALAEAIQQALISMRDGESWQQRRKSARSRVEELYSLEGMVEAYRAVWRDALSG